MTDKLEPNSRSLPEEVPGWLEPGTSTNERRRTAVKLKLQGHKLADIAARVGLSSPSIINAHKAFQAGGWDAVDSKPAGRAPGRGKLDARVQKVVKDALLTSTPEQFDPELSVWTYSAVRRYLKHTHDISLSQRVSTRYCEQWGLAANNLQRQLRPASHGAGLVTAETAGSWWQQEYAPWQQQRLKQRQEVQWIGVSKLKQRTLLHAYSSKNTFSWTVVSGVAKVRDYLDFFNRLSRASRKPVNMVIHGIDIAGQSELLEWFGRHNTQYLLAPLPPASSGQKTPAIDSPMNFTASTTRDLSIMTNGNSAPMRQPAENAGTATDTSKSDPRAIDTTASIPQDNDATVAVSTNRSHLQRLEAESIHIMREVVAEADNPVMLYSSGKDSAVMLHLALKAFYPAKPPFPLLHVDTTWKFSAMYEFRDEVVAKHGMELLSHVNQEGLDKGVNPFTHGSGLHTDIMKTEALKQAIDKHGFDIAFGGARRDEEKSRAKERVFSFRTQQHRWDPKQQRPELWRLYNTRKQKGESIRAFPLSNWTELDIWQYILQESIDIVPLYFAAERPVVERDGSLIMVDDDRLQLQPGEVPMMRSVRFRTLGCYPLTSAIESNASNVKEIIAETLVTKTSERSGRLIDHDAVGSMEKKKQEGYF